LSTYHPSEQELDADPADTQSSKISKKNFRLLVLGCLGVVYGDIGTSPLYAFREAVAHTMHDGALKPVDVYGILSLIIWSLIVVVTIKYVLILLRVDNRGEGGILSLMTMARRKGGSWSRLIFFAGIIGAGLFFGEVCITPAISVLSAVEGLKLVSPVFDGYVIVITIFILLFLFLAQRRGTEAVAKFFGPITAIWFLTLAGTGLYWIVKNPAVLQAFSPHYGFLFLYNHSGISFLILGSVFLAVTGAEALYADLGHFGRKPIQFAWLRIVFPCLVLNYLGQGALVLSHGELHENPFFGLVPQIALIPLVILAAMATIIASQAVITGAFSMARNAVQMGLLPHLRIEHTSADHRGQIYMPQVNRWMLFIVLLLCVTFGSSTALASAYGISVIGTMIVSTFIAFFAIWRIYNKPLWAAALFAVFFFAIEGAFLLANILKLMQGGYISLMIAGIVFLCILIWVRGSKYLHKKVRRQAVLLVDLMEQLERNPLHVIDGTAVFLTSDPTLVPVPMQQNIKHNKVIHAHNVVLTVITSQFPRVPDSQRVVVEKVTSTLTRIYVHYGFMESPDVPYALSLARSKGLEVDHKVVSYFVGHRTIIGRPGRGLPGWQEKIYIAMTRLAMSSTDYYRLPAGRVVEIGIQMTL
jgi:KUP system potassium uptake protein